MREGSREGVVGLDEIVWIRPAQYDPAVQVGSRIAPDASLPVFEVVDRRQVVMMFKAEDAWAVRPFTQLVLRMIEADHL